MSTGITFDSLSEAKEYQKQLKAEGKIARLRKRDNKFLVEIIGTNKDFIEMRKSYGARKPWIIREMTPEEKRNEKGAWATTVHETKEIILHYPKESPELQAHAIRHELGHAKFTAECLYPKDKIDWDEYVKLYPHKAAQEDFYSEAIANYYALSQEPEDKLAKPELERQRKKAIKAGLTKQEIKWIEEKAKQTVSKTKNKEDVKLIRE